MDSTREHPVRWRSIQLARAAADLAAILVSFFVCHQLYAWAIRREILDRWLPPLAPYVAVALLFGAFTIIAFRALGLYRDRASMLNLWEYETAVKGLALASAVLFTVLFFLKLQSFSRLVVVGAIAVSMWLVFAERRLLSAAIRQLQMEGRLGRRVLIYGSGETGRLVMKKIVHAPHLGCSVVGFLDDSTPEGATVECRVSQDGPILRVPVLGRLDELPSVAASLAVDEIFVTRGTASLERMREVFELAAASGVSVAVVPRLGDLRADQVHVEDLGAIPLLRLTEVTSGRARRAAKRALDLLGGAILAVATIPIWIPAGLALFIESGRPILFTHERVGYGGHRFRMFKFRTMRRDVDPYQPSPQSARDSRITTVGRLLRVTGLDELPQVVNVLLGDMSLVGPRPEMPFLVEHYGPLERQRFRVKPGITGLWQLSADRQAHIHENIEYDLYYVGHHSILLDVLILLETVFFTVERVPKALRALLVKTAADRDHAPHGLVSELASGNELAAPAQTWLPAPVSAPGYVLVALDQRGNGEIPITWRHALPVAAALARRWPVKVLAAPPNRAALDRLFAEVDRGDEWEERQTMYVSYRARAELRALSLSALLVITDLPHVAAWASDARVNLLWVSAQGLSWQHEDGQPAEIVAELARHGDSLVSGIAVRGPRRRSRDHSSMGQA